MAPLRDVTDNLVYSKWASLAEANARKHALMSCSRRLLSGHYLAQSKIQTKTTGGQAHRMHLEQKHGNPIDCRIHKKTWAYQMGRRSTRLTMFSLRNERYPAFLIIRVGYQCRITNNGNSRPTPAIKFDIKSSRTKKWCRNISKVRRTNPADAKLAPG